ncbi:hypothetical protein FSARC_10316 [Fusarium sarcochroum]|uniref:Uncharacterized protein n=1 Tax=Fusarium sarcochroum TaxID=1208366 RepID=A0A8H4TNI7_9HYPO|nr:hypothetical protein FSARC_10316 [Fusarium sarcochroum]
MDSSNPRHGSHPSDSIPDAAYPNDSPYRPGDNSPQIMIPPGASTSSHSLHHQPQPPQPYSPTPPSHFGASVPAYSSPTPSPWSPDIPQSPPPPYDPSRPPAIYSPLEPPSPLSPPPHYPPSTPWPYPQGSSAGSSLNGGGAYKMGPVATARARRKRKLQICALAMCAVLLFFIALIMGILMGVVKVQWKDRDDDD